jgi:hypothetical protein
MMIFVNNNPPLIVIPAKAGIQETDCMDSGLRRSDVVAGFGACEGSVG